MPVQRKMRWLKTNFWMKCTEKIKQLNQLTVYHDVWLSIKPSVAILYVSDSQDSVTCQTKCCHTVPDPHSMIPIFTEHVPVPASSTHQLLYLQAIKPTHDNIKNLARESVPSPCHVYFQSQITIQKDDQSRLPLSLFNLITISMSDNKGKYLRNAPNLPSRLDLSRTRVI